MSIIVNMLHVKALPNFKRKRFGYCNIHPLAPQGSALFIAPSNSGKTTLIVNLILRKVFGIIVSYSEIHIMSPTVYADDSWEMVLPDKYKPFKVKCKGGKKRKTATIHVHDSYTPADIEEIMNEQEEKEEEDRKRILIILDDVADSLSQNPILDRLFFRGRHSGIFSWISSQLYRRVPRGLRVNSPYYIFFRVNTNELQTITDELAVEDRNTFKSLFMKATALKHSFLTINVKSSLEDRYTSSFVPLK